jgi:hypothetical protein
VTADSIATRQTIVVDKRFTVPEDATRPKLAQAVLKKPSVSSPFDPSRKAGHSIGMLFDSTSEESKQKLKTMKPRIYPWVLALLLFTVASVLSPGFACAAESGWIQLFNGKDLDGWTPKIRGYELGDNFGRTFRVENGAICVRYDGYGNQFKNRFGHLFYKQSYSNYVLRAEYRFVGEQLPDGPGWALRNSGLMLHGQDPATMVKDQEFPVSIEVQLLGGDGQHSRSTANLCTPGTHVVMKGELITRHCTDSSSKTYAGDQWVTAEVEVHGNGKFIHRVNGETVLEYEHAQLDPGDADAKRLIQGSAVMLFGGTISLQSESHPVEFRKVELKPLSE